MDTFIHHIATSVPEFAYDQTYARDRMKSWMRDPRQKRLVHAIYNRSGIEKRHSVCGDFLEGAAQADSLFQNTTDGALASPGTGARNALYAKAARALAVDVARKAIVDCPGVSARDITHVIFASCTGFTNPGPEYHIIRQLGLAHSVQRYTLGFMGCYAAFPALRMAGQFCAADPEAVVLVVCLELCSLHLQINDQPDTMLANSLFADGAAAAIVSARVPRAGHFKMNGFASALVPSGEEAMAWDIGDNGFNIVLSSYVPEILGENLRPLLSGMLNREGLRTDEVEQWAVHPGGRAILDKVAKSLGLEPEMLATSREILRDFGNMSSATILFVLARLLEKGCAGTTCAMAFGPGLTVESAFLEAVPLRPVEEIIPAVDAGEMAGQA